VFPPAGVFQRSPSFTWVPGFFSRCIFGRLEVFFFCLLFIRFFPPLSLFARCVSSPAGKEYQAQSFSLRRPFFFFPLPGDRTFLAEFFSTTPSLPHERLFLLFPVENRGFFLSSKISIWLIHSSLFFFRSVLNQHARLGSNPFPLLEFLWHEVMIGVFLLVFTRARPPPSPGFGYKTGSFFERYPFARKLGMAAPPSAKYPPFFLRDGTKLFFGGSHTPRYFLLAGLRLPLPKTLFLLTAEPPGISAQ